MKFKLFGKEVFDFGSSKGDSLIGQASSIMKESKFLPDFHTMREYANQSGDLVWTLTAPDVASAGITATNGGNTYALTKKQETEKNKKFALTPKRVFELKFLN